MGLCERGDAGRQRERRGFGSMPRRDRRAHREAVLLIDLEAGYLSNRHNGGVLGSQQPESLSAQLINQS
jgi:hypothetical protein